MKNLRRLLSVLDQNIENAEIENDLIINHLYSGQEGRSITLLSESDYFSNPYYQAIRPKGAKYGELELFYDHYEAGQMFLFDEIKVMKDYREESQIGYFDTRFPFLAIKEKDSIWMSVTPHEINTMKEPTEQAFGNVLVLGLGLGYFPFMISLKSEVGKITIIENNKMIISLFKKHLFPLFPHKEKIEIKEGDAFEHFRESQKYDYVFSDLWHQPLDGLPLYIKLKGMEPKGPVCTYWIEKSMLCLLRRASLIVLEEVNSGATAENFQYSEKQDDKLINGIYHFMMKKNFVCSLEDQDLKEMASLLIL